MSKVNIGVVENEMIIADTICLTLKKLGYEVLPPAYNYLSALKMIEEGKPDLLLMDINLGGKQDGVDIATYVRENYSTPIIFLTANSDAATIERAKPVKPNAFLVKPFAKEDLYSAIEIAISNHLGNGIKGIKKKESILVKDGYDFIKVCFKDIIYLSSEHNYVTFHLVNGKKIMMRSTMQEMVDRLPENVFVRLNRSFIINVEHVSRIETEKVFLNEIEFAITKPIHSLLLEKIQTSL